MITMSKGNTSWPSLGLISKKRPHVRPSLRQHTQSTAARSAEVKAEGGAGKIHKKAGKRQEVMQGIQHEVIRMTRTPEENTMAAPRPTIKGKA